MVLTIDVGNTNTVLGGFEGEELFFVSRIKTDRDRMPDEYAIAFRSIFEINGYGKASFSGAIISSVVPPLLPVLRDAVSKLLGCRVLTVSPGTKTGLDIRIDNPAETGADLVCACVGALTRYPMPCVVVDLGTATKFLVLDKDGNFLGGPIMPGVNISLEALARSAALLPGLSWGGSITSSAKTAWTACRPASFTGQPEWWTACWIASRRSLVRRSRQS